jgi:hypothetical protein
MMNSSPIHLKIEFDSACRLAYHSAINRLYIADLALVFELFGGGRDACLTG